MNATSGAEGVRDPDASALSAPARSEEQAAAAAVGALLASVFRLFKVARMYDATHKILVSETDVAATAVAEFCVSQRTDSVDLVFVGETVFVNGQMPRFSREAYARAMELGGLLDRCGISNVTIAKTVTPSDLLAFVSIVASVLRDPLRQDELTRTVFTGVRARRLRARIGGDAAEVDQSPAARVVRTYACAIVMLRGLYASLKEAGAQPKMPAALRRIAQRIVTHAEQEPIMLVGLSAGAARERDEASTATGTALVAVLMGRQLTADRNTLTNLTLAALLYDVGRQDLLARGGGDELLAASMRTLSEEDQDLQPGRAALGVAALDRIEPVSMPRAVVAFEAHWIRRAQRLGPIYRGKRPPSALARILSTARAFCELMAPGPYSTPMGPEDAIQFLSSRAADETELTYVKLLTGALGLFPVGTTVELSTGEIGVVTRVPAAAIDFSRPPVRVMYDASGNKLSQPFDVDLAAKAAAGAPERRIQRTFDADQEQTQAMRAYVLGVVGPAKGRDRPSSGGAGAGVRGAPGPESVAASDSRSGKRTVAAAETPAPAPAFEERPPTGPGLQSRPRATLLGRAAVEASGSGPASARAPVGVRPRTGAPVPGAVDDRPPTGSPRPARPVTGAPILPSFPASSVADETGPPTSTGKRTAAWKARQAERPRVHDPRAEKESEPPPRPAPSPGPPPEAASSAVDEAPVTPRVPVAAMDLEPLAEHSVPQPPASAPRTLFTSPTRPAMPQVSADRAPVVARSTVAGTRKVSWRDYDKIVDAAGEASSETAPDEAPPGATPTARPPALTRPASWDELEDFSDLADDKGPPDEGL